MNRNRIMVLIVVRILLFAGDTVKAEPHDPVITLTLDQLVADALRENPSLRSMRAKWEAMRERPAQERALPNPMFMYRGMDEVDRGHFPSTSEKRFEVEQSFPWFGKLGLRGSIAEKEAEVMQREVEAMERELVMRVKESYFDLYGVQQALAITRAEKDVLLRLEKTAVTKYATGEVSQQEAVKAQAEISMLEARLLGLEAQETTLKATINALLNRPADDPLGWAVDAPKDSFEGSYEEALAVAEKERPELKGAQANIERSRLERQRMAKEFFPDYRVGVEYRSFRDGEDMMMFTVGIELPLWRKKYRAGVREARNTIESGEGAFEATQRQISLDVRDAHFKVVTAHRTVQLYKNILIPQAEMRFQASEAGYRAGKVDFLDLLESERFLLDARIMLAMAEADLGMQLARLERAIGTGLKPSTGTK